MVDTILSLIGTMLYPLFSIIFVILAIVQAIFKSFAGTGSIGLTGGRTSIWGNTDDPENKIWGNEITGKNDGTETGTGIVYYMLTRPLVQNLIMSIMLLALFLIIIFTVMAFIKNAYATKQKPWQEIVGNAFKGLAGFIFIPVCCLLGTWAGNILLNAIDGATSTGGSVELEKKLFIACAYNANDIRLNKNSYNKKGKIEGKGDENKTKAYNLCAILIDDAKDSNGNPLNITLEDRGENCSDEDMEYYASIVDTVYSQADYTKSLAINIYDWGSVGRGYALWNINYLVLIVVGIFMIGVMLNLAYGMIKRLFWLVLLFVVSPALCALYPLDEGSAVGGYKKEFIKHTISAYSAVAGMNIFMSLLPLVESISLTNFSGLGWINDVDMYVQLIVMVSGLFVVKEFISTISGWIGGGNALADGESLKKSVTDSMKMEKQKKALAKGVGVFGKAVGVSRATGRRRDFFGSFVNQAFEETKKSSGYSDMEKSWKESRDAGEKEIYTKVKEDNIRKIADKYIAGNEAGAIADAKAAGVEKDMLEVVAKELNERRIRDSIRTGSTDVVSFTSAEKLEEHAKATKEEQDARKEFVDASQKATDIRSDASALLLSAHASGSLGSIGGLNLVRQAMRQRSHIEMQESWGSAERSLAMQFNAMIDKLSESDSEFKAAGNSYYEKAKAVADIKGGIRDQSETGFQVHGHGPASKTEIKENIDDIIEAATNTADSLNSVRVNFDDAVQSLQRFSAGVTASTNLHKRRVTEERRGQRVIDQTKSGKK